MKNKWVKTAFAAGGLAILTVSTVLVFKGRNAGTVVVTNVHELIEAIGGATERDTIVLSTQGSPYYLSERPCMNGDGHLFVTKGITIRGQSGNPDDVVLIGSTNRILYVKAPNVVISGITFKNGCSTSSTKDGSTSGNKVWGGGIYLGLATNECRIANCIFTNNIAQRGGALASNKPNDPTTSITGCRFVGNSAEEHGGAVYNGGRLSNCIIKGNMANKYGGGVYCGVVYLCSVDGNVATRGCELSDCTVSRYSYVGEVSDGISRFNNVMMDRSKITATNGIVFSGSFEVRSSAITDGAGFTLSSNLALVNERRGFEEYDSVGGTNIVYYENGSWNPRLINCTIVSNKSYKLVKAVSAPSTLMEVKNCLFYNNTISQGEGIKVNKYLATNNCYKTVQMTKAQRLIALGWDGSSFNTTITCEAGNVPTAPEYYVESGQDWINNVYRTVDVQFPDNTTSIDVTYNQYFHARGWNGDTSPMALMGGFEQKNDITVKIGSKSYNLMEVYSNDLTWWDYYINDMHWDGVSDYTGGDVQNKDIEENAYAMIQGIEGCILNAADNYKFGNCYFYDPRSFNPMFAGAKAPNDFYSIDKRSAACHSSFGMYGISDIWTYPREIWMKGAKDLRGSPRLYGGGLDIGAYQAAVFYPFVMVIR